MQPHQIKTLDSLRQTGGMTADDRLTKDGIEQRLAEKRVYYELQARHQAYSQREFYHRFPFSEKEAKEEVLKEHEVELAVEAKAIAKKEERQRKQRVKEVNRARRYDARQAKMRAFMDKVKAMWYNLIGKD